MKMLTQDELKSLLHYDPDTGLFTRLKQTNGRIKVGEIAGGLNHNGYLMIKVNNKQCRAHRLAFFYITGTWPKNEIDHINHIRTDNRWCNLREATRAENMFNSKRTIRNTSGHKGVSWRARLRKWEVNCNVYGKSFYLGQFKELEEAVKTYQDFAKMNFGEFYNKGY